MDTNALLAVVKYADEQAITVQLTRNAGGIWTADFANDIHAKVCHQELVEDGHVVQLAQQFPLRMLRIA